MKIKSGTNASQHNICIYMYLDFTSPLKIQIIQFCSLSIIYIVFRSFLFKGADMYNPHLLDY